VFIEEEVARRHLHELWLRELEGWTCIDGNEGRLDDSDARLRPRSPSG
jgi:hypothetical protein